MTLTLLFSFVLTVLLAWKCLSLLAERSTLRHQLSRWQNSYTRPEMVLEAISHEQREAAVTSGRQRAFDAFYWDGILLDARHRDALYARFLACYEVDATDATRYAMAVALSDEAPDERAIDVICDHDADRDEYTWPDGSVTPGRTRADRRAPARRNLNMI